MKTFKKMIAMTAITCMSLTALTGCGSKEASEDVVKIGVNYELSGPVAQYGQSHVDGIKLATDEINAAGGIEIDGKKYQIELDILDNQSNVTEVNSVAQKLASNGNILILGPATSGNTSVGFSVSKETKVPTISASATSDGVTLEKDGKTVTPYGFKTCFNDSFQGVTIATYVTSKGFDKAIVISDKGSDYAEGIRKNFIDQYKKNGGKIVADEFFNDSEKDFNSLATKLKNTEADVIVIAGYYEQTGLIVKALRELGIDKTIVGTDGFDGESFAKLAGKKNLNDVYFTTHFSTKDEEKVVQDFISNFNKEYGKNPGAFEALGYDMVYFAKQAIEQAGSLDSEDIKKALENTESFSGVTGTFSMGASHVAKKSIKVVGLVNGEQTTVETIDPAN